MRCLLLARPASPGKPRPDPLAALLCAQELVAVTRQQLRQLPQALGEATAGCVDTAVDAMRGASMASERAIGDGASSLVCGCGIAESAITSELARARDLLVDEVIRAARGPAPPQQQEAHDVRWGAMWARLDELGNASLQRCVGTTRELGEWAAEALPAPCAAVEALVRDVLPRMRTTWHMSAVRIGRALQET